MIAVFLLQIIIAIVYQNFLEWVLHNIVLHKIGRNKNSIVSYHWHRHHKIVRTNNYRDDDYKLPFYKLNTKSKEILGLLLLVVLHIPILFFYPVVFITLLIGCILYYQLHKKSHVDTEWGKKYLPWHYDHHCGTNQNLNYCVTFPLFDYLFGTRVKYKYDSNGKCVKKQQ